MERGGIVGLLVQREGRIAVGPERPVGVEEDAPGPAQDAEVEVEDPARVAAGEEDREERDHGQDEHDAPEDEQHEVVRDHEEPLDQPEPAPDPRVELAAHRDRVDRRAGLGGRERAGGSCGRGRDRRGGGGRPPRAEDDEENPGGEQEHARDQQADRQPEEEVRLGARAQVGTDSLRGVGVHEHDRPLARLGLPGGGLLAGARGRRGPERLLARRPCRRAAAEAPVLGAERVEVEVAHLVVRDAVEVGIDVGGLRDPHEDVARSLDGEPNVAEHSLGEHPVPARVRLEQVDALRGDRVGVRLEELGGRGQEAVVVAVGPVGPEERPADGEQPGGEQRDEAAEDDEQDPSCGPVRPARRRRCRAVGGHD